MRTATRRTLLASALALLPAPSLEAQPRARVSGSVETGAAAIEQPLVRSGAAFYIAPVAQLTARDATIGAGAVLATGTPMWQSFLGTGFVRSPAVRNLRLTGSGQVLKTSGLLHTLHGDAGVEWRASSARNTGVLSLNVGQLSYNGAWWRDMSVGATGVRSRGPVSVVLDASYTNAQRPRALQEQIGSREAGATSLQSQVLDLTPRMIWERSRLRADASLALRAVESGVRGTRIGPQLSFTLQTTRGLSLFVGGVQRLPDVRSGVPAGRSALLGLRVEGRRLLSTPARKANALPALRVENTALIVDAGPMPTYRVELRGDFTNWQLRTCHPRGTRYFDCGAAPAAGTWRVSVRINEGAWQQPANLAPVADDFGSVDGVLMTGGKP